jgi:hypothetical protein
VAPLVNDVRAPNRLFDLDDLLVIQQNALGGVAFYMGRGGCVTRVHRERGPFLVAVFYVDKVTCRIV